MWVAHLPIWVTARFGSGFACRPAVRGGGTDQSSLSIPRRFLYQSVGNVIQQRPSAAAAGTRGKLKGINSDTTGGSGDEARENDE